MTLRLTLIRHAKSSWDGEEPDHDRTLSPRGREAADALGRWLVGQVPEEALCSAAARTRETWARIAGACHGPEARPVPELYHADPATILRVLRTATAPHVAIIGHNPGIATFAHRIAARPADHARFGDYPTGATTVITFDAPNWAEVSWGMGQVVDFVIPRDL